MKRVAPLSLMVFARVCLGATAPAAKEPITFYQHIAPILYQHCAPCHRPEQSAPFSLLTLADARKHVREMADVTARRFMPPWLPAPGHGEFLGERRLTELEIATFARWQEGGALAGDPKSGVAPPTFASDWQLGPPDLIVKMPAAYTVPASGRDVYRHFVLPVGLSQRRYVKAWEFRPHGRAVHHAFLRVDRSGEGRRHDASDPEPGFPGMDTPNLIQSPGGHFASWQPGAAPRVSRPGLSWMLEPGADIVMQMHLQPLGKPEALQSEIGFYFTDQPPTNQPVKVSLINYDIDLAPGVTNEVVTDEFTLPADADLLGVLPHTHYLGRRIEGWVHPPDGAAKALLLIPDWDFNWQGDYVLRKPVFLPAGTRLEMRVTFDNSTNNLRNPANPPKRVRFGPNTTDEMAELWWQLLPRTTEGAATFQRSHLERTTRDVIAYNKQRLRIDPGDAPALVNLGKAAIAQNRTSDARAFLDRALESAPNLDEAHYYSGVLHRMNNNAGAAAGEFARALALNPNHVRAHGNLGVLHLQFGRPERAAEHFSQAVALDPTDALAHGLLGSIRLHQGRIDDAERLLNRAVELDPSDEEARKNLATVRERRPSKP